MRITSLGNVGIGNSSPGAKLDIGTAGTSLGTLRLAGNTSGYVQLQPAAAAGSWTMTLPATAGTSGQVLSTNGSGVTSWAAASSGAALSALTAATVANSISNGNFNQTWQWNTLSGTTALSLTTTSTAAASNNQKILNIGLTGANATAAQTTYGAYLTNAHTGTTSTNVGLYASASGGTNNYAALFPAGNVGIGTTTPSSLLSVNGQLGVTGNAYIGSSSGQFIELSPSSSIASYIDFRNGATTVMRIPTGTSTGAGNVGIGTTTPAAPLHVNGAAIIGTSALTCSATTEGAMRYNTTSKYMEFCNGTAWNTINGAGTGGITPGCGASGTLSTQQQTTLNVAAGCTVQFKAWGGGGGGAGGVNGYGGTPGSGGGAGYATIVTGPLGSATTYYVAVGGGGGGGAAGGTPGNGGASISSFSGGNGSANCNGAAAGGGGATGIWTGSYGGTPVIIAGGGGGAGDAANAQSGTGAGTGNYSSTSTVGVSVGACGNGGGGGGYQASGGGGGNTQIGSDGYGNHGGAAGGSNYAISGGTTSPGTGTVPGGSGDANRPASAGSGGSSGSNTGPTSGTTGGTGAVYYITY